MPRCARWFGGWGTPGVHTPGMADDDSQWEPPAALADRWSVAPEDAWRLLTEPMNQSEAETAARAIGEALPHVYALPVNPRRTLVLAWERGSVEMFVEALSTIAAAGRPVPERLIQSLMDWVGRADRLDDDDDAWPSL